MATYINKEEWQHLLETYSLEEGQSIRINHSTSYCEGSSNSGKLSRTNNGYTFTCFRCGRWGRYNLNESRASKLKSTSLLTTARFNNGDDTNVNSSLQTKPTKRCRLPIGYTNTWKNFSRSAKHFLLRRGIQEEHCNYSSLGWDTKQERLVFPLWDTNGHLYYQTRALPKKIEGCKSSEFGVYNAFDFAGKCYELRGTCIIVEDFISAARVAMLCPAFPMMSNNIPVAQMLHLTKQYTSFIIWMDNDRTDIKKKALKLHSKLQLYNKSSRIVWVETEPKELSDDEIKRVLLNE